jgi:hypothetical protein
MRNRLVWWLTALVAAGVLGCSPAWAQTDEDEDDAPDTAATPAVNSQFPWPSQFSADGQSFTVYPPELDRWDGDQLQGRAAVSVQTGNDAKPLYGVAELAARVQVDQATQVATLGQIRIVRVTFPTAPQDAPRFLELLQPHLSAVIWQLPVDQLRGELAVDRAARVAHSQPVRNEAPTVIFSDRPAILVPIDGSPVLRDMVGLGLKRVLNTRALILQDRESDRYFIFVAGRWLEARTLDGPWIDAQIRPSALDDAKQQAQASGQVDLLDADNRASGATRIFVSTTPTELVQTEGPPQYSPVSGTQLLYVTNTPNRLFLDLRTQQYYVLLAGRWFRTRALDQSRWEYVAGSALPSDFAMIPDSHPTATVREAVPGTPQADEAAIVNSIPQVASVKRSEARLDLTYDGTPQFKPIEGTALDYAVNAAVPVIRVDDRNFYALDNGVWFFSATVNGPWSPASYVPPVIYSIPLSSPLHYVTYVRVYGATADSVSVGYSPGYVGSYVTTENTVVYGSGYYYRPWVGTVWYGYPVTWGFGFSYWNTWWNPWPWRHRWAFRPAPCFHPAWGPWHRRFAASRTVVAPVVGAPGPRPVVANRVNVTNTTNVTNIYQRWGRHIATPNRATVVPIMRARAAAPEPVVPGAQPDGRIFRQRDGQWQRFSGNGQWENSAPPANASEHLRNDAAGRAHAAPVPVVPAPAAGTPPAITVPQHDRRAVSDSSNNTNTNPGNMPRPIVGPTPGISSTPDSGNVARHPPGSTARPIVGPPPGIPTAPQPGNVVPGQPSTARPIVGPPPGISNPGISNPGISNPGTPNPGISNPGMPNPDADPASNGRHEGRRHLPRGDPGRANVIVPSQPSTTPPAVRQRFEERGTVAAPPRPVPVPVTPQAFPRGRVDSGAAGHVSRPPVISAPPPVNGRTTGAVGGREERAADGRGNNQGRGRRDGEGSHR